MTKFKTIFISALTTGLLVLAGCTTQTTTNTNATVNTNTASNNANIEIATNTTAVVASDNTNKANTNENTNSDQESEVDTSDWLTYTNEEYGFSFKYPKGWEVNIEKTQLKSRIFEGSLIYVIQLLENDELKLAVLPEGQVDHGLGSDIQISNAVIDNKTVTVLYSNTYQVYKFDNFPQKDSEFRTESSASNVLDKVLIEKVIVSIDFES